ncbi:M48 family metalloprotease [Micromonospora sp. NPDC047074]|uniref:M48 family metalloprotease n=1 Tax=Micromonospora sp. NPDC047074 TaxID=3154339 RepID=UPI003408409F
MRSVGPTASRVRFGVLVGAVLAAGLVFFLTIELHLPGRTQAAVSLNGCTEAFEAGQPAAGDDQELRRALAAEFRSCLRPVLTGQVAFAAAGLAALAGVAALGYAGHPRWLVRRHRLLRLSTTASPRLVADLDELARTAGLARTPSWWLAPGRRTTGGQAFGLPGRRRVALDAGLLVLRARDLPAFRAVVRHELAHLRNRDIDMTYLTVWIWRAFVVVAVVPSLVLLAHPGLFVTPTRWSRQPAAAPAAELLTVLLVLTCLVYLLRNAVLRVRELHADAVATRIGGSAEELDRALAGLPATRSLAVRWGTHPSGPDRRRAVGDPTVLLAPRLGELVAVGLPLGVLTTNLLPLFGLRLGMEPVLGLGLLGLPVGAVLAAVLALSVWRSVARAAVAPGSWVDGRPPPGTGRMPHWSSAPLVLVGSYLAGTLLSVQIHDGGFGLPGTDPATRLTSALVLVAGAVLVAAWATAAARVAQAGPPPRWALPAVLAAAALAGGAACTVWLPFSLGGISLRPALGAAPAAGADIDWYAHVAAGSGTTLGQIYRLVNHPLVLPAATALWLVPACLSHRVGGGRTAVRRAVTVGLVGGAVAAVIGGLLPVAARLALPAEVRRAPPAGSVGAAFNEILDGATLMVVVLAVTVVTTVVVAGRGPGRPVTAPLAAMVTAMLAAVAYFAVATPVQCGINVWAADAPPSYCSAPPSTFQLAVTTHWVLVQGIVVAVPALLVVAVLRLVRRPAAPTGTTAAGPAPHSGAASEGRWARRVLTGALALLAALAAFYCWKILPNAYEVWLWTTFG